MPNQPDIFLIECYSCLGIAKKIVLTKKFFLDLDWFDTFLTQYNGAIFYDQTTCHSQMHLEASLTGLGAVIQNMVYSLPLPRGYMDNNIAQLEILNILFACKVWVSHWANKRIKIWCDNQAVVLTTGKSRDNILSVCARNIGSYLLFISSKLKYNTCLRKQM